MQKLQQLVKNEEGQTLVEYALIIAIIGVALAGALTLLKDKISDTFTAAGAQMPAGTTTP
ncbi:MAG: Flp/Fap pilin component [Desulfotomaculum sp. 46_296]|nr:MAG: Flp/Fap pilin component [Desulfotomaculum sp. 46_296]HAU32095.1 Flp family type IVb pilin [Desulfotomaculum sp.]